MYTEVLAYTEGQNLLPDLVLQLHLIGSVAEQYEIQLICSHSK